MQNHASHFRDRVKKAGSGAAVPAEMVEFYDGLFDYLQKQHAFYSASGLLPTLQPHDLPVADKGKHIFSEQSLRLLASGIEPLIRLMAAHHPGMTLEPLRGALEGGALSDFAGAFLTKDAGLLERLALTHKADRDQAVFIITNLLKPFLAALREANAGLVIQPDESRRLCPFCGHYPDMAAIVGVRDGKRFLHCSLCENRWPYRRIACAVCGCEDADKLEFLSREEYPRYRIDLCHACGGYIKTVRLDKFEDADACDLAVENICTPHFDAAALQAGFRRP